MSRGVPLVEQVFDDLLPGEGPFTGEYFQLVLTQLNEEPTPDVEIGQFTIHTQIRPAATYEVAVPAGDYSIEIVAEGYRGEYYDDRLFPPGDPVTVLEGQETSGINFALDKYVRIINPSGTIEPTDFVTVQWMPIVGVEQYELHVYDPVGVRFYSKIWDAGPQGLDCGISCNANDVLIQKIGGDYTMWVVPIDDSVYGDWGFWRFHRCWFWRAGQVFAAWSRTVWGSRCRASVLV